MSLDHTTRLHPALTGAWRLEPADSTVEFTGRHFFLLPVGGSFPVRSGRVELAPDGTLVRLDATVAAAGFETGNPQHHVVDPGAGEASTPAADVAHAADRLLNSR
ncbi:YceI family protein, partial [Streptomyces sp. NPDC006265]|uniref:YceI family protein n=1 Tax=Streptomyces sp. NPDC006265 TaxID=3156740 RepID=UPI00339DF2CF